MKQSTIRYFIMVLTGILITFILKYLVFNRLPQITHSFFWDLLATTFITFIVWIGNGKIDAYLNKKHPWMPNTGKRIIIQIIYSLVFSLPIIYGMMAMYGYILCKDSPEHDKLMVDSLIIASLIVTIIISLEIGTYFFTSWKNSLVEVEKYKTESAQAQLQNLKNQINPHFLFNNMSVLSSLVYKDQDKSVSFINQLSKVYRYLLDNRNNELVSLQEELDFVKSYIFLLQIRFDENIEFNINVPNTELQKKVPPMCLQVLVENTIKHNEVSSAHPLHVNISTQNNYITVSNNLQLRKTPVASAKLGLQNIKDRYAYLSDLPINISDANNIFIVSLPLLNA